MARKAKREDDEDVGMPVLTAAVEGEVTQLEIAQAPAPGKKSRGPHLHGCRALDEAIVRAMRQTTSAGAVVDLLREDPALEELREAITIVAVRRRARILRAAGVDLPPFARHRVYSPGYVIDPDALNGL